jgi:hypothetical protein
VVVQRFTPTAFASAVGQLATENQIIKALTGALAVKLSRRVSFLASNPIKSFIVTD